MAGIAAWATAIPMWRLQRAMLGTAWDTPALPGERAVAAGDQDSLTLGAEAALACVADAEQVDAIFFATTTPPYAEKHAAATIAGVLDRFDVRTADITGSIRAGTSALRAAIDAVDSGAARAALVVVADMRPAEPATASEQLFGDAAAALLVTPDGPVRVLGAASIAQETAGPWRRSKDDYVRNFDAKFETEFGYARNVETAVKTALEHAGVSADAITRFAAYAPDPRTFVTTAKRIGLGQVKDPLFTSIGNLGAAHAIVSLAHALDEAAAGEHIVVAAAGEGADAIVLTKTTVVSPAAQTVAQQIARKRILPTYERYVRFRKLIPSEDPDVPSSTIRYWRDRKQALPLYGVRCTACGVVQFPANRACISCSTFDQMEQVRLAKTGTVFTFTLDHLVAGEYLETPVPRLVVELDALPGDKQGGRIFLEGTDCEPDEVAVGMRVELTFRLMHEGAGFKNYYWKARPEHAGHQG